MESARISTEQWIDTLDTGEQCRTFENLVGEATEFRASLLESSNGSVCKRAHNLQAAAVPFNTFEALRMLAMLRRATTRLQPLLTLVETTGQHIESRQMVLTSSELLDGLI